MYHKFVMVHATNVRENLLKRGWQTVPSERLDTLGASVLPFNQRRQKGKLGVGTTDNCNESFELENMQEPKYDVENLLNMWPSTKGPCKAYKCRGPVDKLTIQGNLLKLGWCKQNDESTASGGDSANTSVSATDNMTNLDKWHKDFEERRKYNIQITESSPVAIDKDVKKLMEMFSSKKVSFQDKPNQGPMDKLELRESLLAKGWYAAPNNRLPQHVANADDLNTPNGSDAKSTENLKAIKKRNGQINPDEQLGDTTQPNYKSICLNEAVNLEVRPEKSALKSQQTRVSENPQNRYRKVISSKQKKNILFVERWLEGLPETFPDPTKANDAKTRNRRKVKTKSAIPKEKSKKTNPHEAEINSLLEQGWSITKKSRHQITVAKVPESTSKNDASTPGDAHEKTLFERFISRSQKIMGRLFICGRKED